MRLKYLTYINLCTVLTCVTLITFIVLVFNSNILSSGKEQTIYSSDENIFIMFYKRIKNGLQQRSVQNSNNISIFGKEDSLETLNYGSKSEKDAITHNKELSQNIMENANQTKRNTSEILLYRKRRYLLFPEGSSFQLVFDLVVPIIDLTNYAIMGVTVALAWELPSKAPSEIENDLVEKLTDGTFGLSRNDSVNNIKYIDKPHHYKQNHLSHIIYVHPSEYQYQTLNDKTAYYSQSEKYPTNRRPVYTRNQERLPQNHNSIQTYNSPFRLKSINNERIDIRTQPENWKQYYAKRPPAQESAPRWQDNFSRPRQHAVYHVMGKRSIQPKTEDVNPWLEHLDKVHLLYHRTSRHELYSKIEGLFHKQGKNGTECVLRTLCETGRRRHETEPGTLVTEIMRTIFTLPEENNDSTSKYYHPKQKIWEEAYRDQRNCSDTYPLCENYIFSSDFMF